MKKNTVLIGLIALVIVNVLLFKILLDKQLDLVEVPIAKVQIEPRTKIEEGMLDTVKVSKALLNEDCILDIEEAIGKYTEIEGIIPKGSLLYQSMLFEEE